MPGASSLSFKYTTQEHCVCQWRMKYCSDGSPAGGVELGGGSVERSQIYRSINVYTSSYKRHCTVQCKSSVGRQTPHTQQ